MDGLLHCYGPTVIQNISRKIWQKTHLMAPRDQRKTEKGQNKTPFKVMSQ
jgi:hypothetical protein